MAWADRRAKLSSAVFSNLADGLAIYTPKSGAPVNDVPIIVSEPDQLAGLDGARTVVCDARIEVQISVLPAVPLKGARFAIGGRTFECVDKAKRNEGDGVAWTVDVREV